MLKTDQNIFKSIKLISFEKNFNEMINLYDGGNFPKVLLLNGMKGIGKFTLVFHFLNYIYSKNEKTTYNIKENLIDINSKFYNSILNQTCRDVIFLQAEEGKNIKLDDIRNLKAVLSQSSLSQKSRFIIIDEVEFLNTNTVNALLKTLEEPSKNNFFILINNQQTNLIETISSRCLKNNIFLNLSQRKKILKYLIEDRKINLLIDDEEKLTPGLLIYYNELYHVFKISTTDNIFTKIKKLLYAYKKDKKKALISLSIFLIDQFFYLRIKKNENKIELLLNLKSAIVNKINDFVIYNININSVLNTIELKLKNVR